MMTSLFSEKVGWDSGDGGLVLAHLANGDTQRVDQTLIGEREERALEVASLLCADHRRSQGREVGVSVEHDHVIAGASADLGEVDSERTATSVSLGVVIVSVEPTSIGLGA